jgi:heteromeric Ino2p/Ino4p transcription factor
VLLVLAAALVTQVDRVPASFILFILSSLDSHRIAQALHCQRVPALLHNPTMSSDSSRNADHNRDSVSSNNETPGHASLGADSQDKPRLTDQEKKNNHIASEQKRRAAIREGFDRLTELVPGLEGQGRSESVVLKKTVDFLRSQLDERRELVAEIERVGGHVDDSFRLR